jgi:hypothetical protein
MLIILIMEPKKGKSLTDKGFTMVSLQGFDLSTVLVMDVHRIQSWILLAKSGNIIRVGDVDRDTFDGFLQAQKILDFSKQVVLSRKKTSSGTFVMRHVVLAQKGS